MKTISLNVSDDYVVSTFISKCNIDDIELLLTYGESLLKSHKDLVDNGILNNLDINYQQQISELKARNDFLKSTYETRENDRAEEYKQSIERAVNDANMRISLSENYISELRIKHMSDVENMSNKINEMRITERDRLVAEVEKSNDIIKQRHDAETQKILTEIKLSHSNHVDSLNNQINQLNTDMANKEQCLQDVGSIVKYYTYENNTSKGSKGENKVQELLKEYYSKSIVHDMSKVAHAGDLLFSNSNLNCLIEIKNKKTIIEGDISKFISDTNDMANKEKINCALFVSLISENIPTRGSFFVEITNGIPVIYIYLFSPNAIKFAIETLQFLVKTTEANKNAVTANELKSDTLAVIYNSFNTVITESRRMDDIIKNLEKQITQLRLTKKHLGNTMEQITTYYEKHKIPSNKTNIVKPAVDKTTKPNVNKSNTDTEAASKIDVIAKSNTNKEIKGFTKEQIDKLKMWVIENKKVPDKNKIGVILGIKMRDIGTKEIRIVLLEYHKKQRM
jgi:hypothetical protein